MGVGWWWGCGRLLFGTFGFGAGFVSLLALAGLMRLYKIYDVVITSHGLVVILTLSLTVDHQPCYKFTKFWPHSGLNEGNIVGLKGLVWFVLSRCPRCCWCRMIFEFGIGAWVQDGVLLGLCCLSIFVDLAGSCDWSCIYHFEARFWLADSFDVEFYCFVLFLAPVGFACCIAWWF